MDDFSTIIPIVFAFYLGCTYVIGFIFAQNPYIKDFGVLPFQQVHYLYSGFYPLIYVNAYLFLYSCILIALKNYNKLKEPSFWVIIVLTILEIILFIMQYQYKMLVLDLFIIFGFILMDSYFIYAIFYNYIDLIEEDSRKILKSLKTEIESLKIKDSQHFESNTNDFDKLINMVSELSIEDEVLPDYITTINNINKLEMKLIGSNNTDKTLIERLKILKSVNSANADASKEQFKFVDSRYKAANSRVKTTRQFYTLSTALLIFIVIQLSVGTLSAISTFDTNYLNKDHKTIYTLVLASDSNVSIDMPKSQKIRVVLINENYIYGYITEDGIEKPIIIRKDIVGKLVKYD